MYGPTCIAPSIIHNMIIIISLGEPDRWSPFQYVSIMPGVDLSQRRGFRSLDLQRAQNMLELDVTSDSYCRNDSFRGHITNRMIMVFLWL